MKTVRYKVVSRGNECFGVAETTEQARNIISMYKNSKTNGKSNMCSTLEYSMLPFEDDGTPPVIELKYATGKYPPGNDSSIR